MIKLLVLVALFLGFTDASNSQFQEGKVNLREAHDLLGGDASTATAAQATAAHPKYQSAYLHFYAALGQGHEIVEGAKQRLNKVLGISGETFYPTKSPTFATPPPPTLPAAFAECTTLMKASNFEASGFKWDPHQHSLDVRGQWSDISGNDNHAMSTTMGIKPSDWRQCSEDCQESRYPLPESHWTERFGPDSGVHLKHSAGNGAAASIPYVQGGMQTMIEWPEGTLPPLFTVCTVTRYAGTVDPCPSQSRGGTCKKYPGSLTHGTETVAFAWHRQSRGELVQSDAGAAMGGTMRPNYVRAPGMTVDGAARQRTRKWSHGHSEGRVGVAKYAHWKTAAAAVAPEFLDPPRDEDNAFSPDTDWLIHWWAKRRNLRPTRGR
jgi:hypothetical protein